MQPRHVVSIVLTIAVFGVLIASRRTENDSVSESSADFTSADNETTQQELHSSGRSANATPPDVDESSAVTDPNSSTPSYNSLSDDEAYVILQKGTERPSNGGYTMTKDPGTYICRQCNQRLFTSDDKFESHCGWPSFDDEIDGAVKRMPDADGHRVEIVCSNCDGHLGHVFEGERLTPKDTRHCVNSISMKFIPQGDDIPETIR